MQKRTEKVKDEQRGGKKEVSREERSVGTLSNTGTLEHTSANRCKTFISYAAFQFCWKVGNSGFKLGQTSKEGSDVTPTLEMIIFNKINRFLEICFYWNRKMFYCRLIFLRIQTVKHLDNIWQLVSPHMVNSQLPALKGKQHYFRVADYSDPNVTPRRAQS